MPKRAALYLRVSTAEQTTDNQRLELARWAAARGYEVVEIFEDRGVSGSKSRDRRPGLDALLKSATRRKIDVVAAWSVDRLGRSMTDLVNTLSELHASGCDLYLHQQAVDTTTPAGRALFGMSSVFSEFERSMTVARVHAGLARARAAGKTLGRPRIPLGVRKIAVDALLAGASVSQVVKLTGTSVGTVSRLRKELANAVA